jgi:hypothetical protein
VLQSEYETLAHLFVAKLQLLLAYHASSVTFQIRITECRILRHGPGIHGEAAALNSRCFPASDWSSAKTEILTSSPEWGSWICTKPGCHSVRMYHSSSGTPWEQSIRHWSTCIPVFSGPDNLVSFFLIMCSLTLNQWMRWKQIVIYHDTSHWGAGSSSRLASDVLSITAWLG